MELIDKVNQHGYYDVFYNVHYIIYDKHNIVHIYNIMADIECSTKPHFINGMQNYYVPSIYDDVAVDLSFVSHMDHELNFVTSKTPDMQRGYIQIYEKKNIMYTLLTEYINPYNYVTKYHNIVKQINMYKNFDIINEYSDKELIDEIKTLQEYKINISMDKLITTTSWEYWELFTKFSFIPMDKKVKAFFISKHLSYGGVEMYLKYRESKGINLSKDTYDVYEMAEDVMNPTGFIHTDSSIVDKLKSVYPNVNYNLVKPNICNLKEKYFNDVYNTIISNVYYLDGNYINYAETHNSYYLLIVANLVINNLDEYGNLMVLVREMKNKLTWDLIFLICSCFDNSYICRESSKMHVGYKKLICISKNTKKTNDIKDTITKIIDKWVFNNIDNDICQNKTTSEDMLVSVINADNDYYELIERYETLIENQKKLFISMRDVFLDSYRKSKDKISFIREQQAKIIYSSVKWFKCYGIPISYEYEEKEVKENISNELLNSDTFIRYTYSKKANKDDDYFEKTTLESLYANYIMCLRIMESSEDKELWFKLRAYVRHYTPLKQIVSDITKIKVSHAFLKLYEIFVSYDFFKNFDEVNSFHICETGQIVAALGHYMVSNMKNKKWSWCGQTLNHKSDINVKKYGSGIFADNYGLMKKFPKNWTFGPKDTGDITDIDNINYYAKNYNKINFITSDCGITKEDLEGYIHKEYSTSVLTLCEILLSLKMLQKNGCFIIKVFMPIKSKINISLLYILYQSFEKVSIYKPQMNPGSLEVYVIGEGYKSCDSDVLNKIETLIKSNIEKMNGIDNDSYNNIVNSTDNDSYIIPVPEEFIKMHIEMTELMLEGAKIHILRKMFLCQYPDFFEKNKIDVVKLQNDICIDWTKKYKLKYEKNNPFI